ncbi:MULTISPECIES: hypothetical protein [unclassified Mucilaginibacter]|uniref:hypothetical protein n=1 Tax=unclassified Mucilaginibacter TaxID=2617802 RepID=UPI0031F6A342
MDIFKAEKVNASIEIQEEIAHTQVSWLLQKVAWVSLFVIVALVIAGLFGDGAASYKSVNQGHFNVQYDQLFRYQAEKMIRISSKSQTIKTVAIAQSLMNYFKISQIIPEPTRSYIVKDKRVYEFYADRNFTIAFYLTPMEHGSVSGKIEVNDEVFDIKHFIYP